MVRRSSIKIPNDRTEMQGDISSGDISLDEVFKMMKKGMILESLEFDDGVKYGMIKEYIHIPEYREEVTTLLEFSEVVDLTNMLARNGKAEA